MTDRKTSPATLHILSEFIEQRERDGLPCDDIKQIMERLREGTDTDRDILDAIVFLESECARVTKSPVIQRNKIRRFLLIISMVLFTVASIKVGSYALGVIGCLFIFYTYRPETIHGKPID